ncbi:class I adenylate-forming enzyme family protein [Rhodococcus sp. SGAir0479]|uniref:class I adenylate-forming enzyme family protein n=1 Tax=Rhodococcus sp. SGAir0479 TaxID=2567884 RepID=UPI0010CD3F3D|nr:class I adenylate-forming enzyme family protein [Rhodococcus sp. SGAir0479]QCQ92699.1 acyl--CoA ligase [Rhodococcus sp. SGAir0479]
MTVVDAATAAQYVESGWWGTESLHQLVHRRATQTPHRDAFVTPDGRTDWATYDSVADDIAAALVALGVDAGDRVAVQLPDTFLVHAALVAAARAGVVAVGIGARAGDRELAHLIRKTGARTLVTAGGSGGRPSDALVATLREQGVVLDFHVVLSGAGVERICDVRGRAPVSIEPGRADRSAVAARSLGPNELCMLNSTSGTTGLPKCVTQFDNRWMAFSRLAIDAGGLGDDEVFFGAVPAPFGFGLWTSHYAPAVLGAPTIVLPKFDVGAMIRMIEREKVTVLCCVSTQFRMLLNSPLAHAADLSSLRVMFTGGEAVPADRAAEFESRTGASVLQFFGSNESGAFSVTRVDDPRERRLGTSGRLIPEMQVRLFDAAGNDVTDSGGPGQPGGKGPLTCGGYYDDEAANGQLYTKDGWLLMGDLVTIEDGYLTPVGRTSDIIIRGGKNISAPQVEQEVETHPAVDLAAVVAVPDPVFGERVCAVVSLRADRDLTLDALVRHLAERGVSKELYPEHLVVVDELPRSSGGKIAKGDIRALAADAAAGAR